MQLFELRISEFLIDILTSFFVVARVQKGSVVFLDVSRVFLMSYLLILQLWWIAESCKIVDDTAALLQNEKIKVFYTVFFFFRANVVRF